VSEENVELVRAVYDAVGRRDAAAVLSLYDQDVEWDGSRSALTSLEGRRVYRGHDGLREWFRDHYAAWEHIDHHCDELIDAGDEVVSVVTSRGRGRASGIEVEIAHGAVWTIRGGKVIRVVWFETPEEALESVGLGTD
jgi:ketosteroid isomerase-like protein